MGMVEGDIGMLRVPADGWTFKLHPQMEAWHYWDGERLPRRRKHRMRERRKFEARLAAQ